MKKQFYVQCQGCGSSKALLIFEPRYRGLRGRCSECSGDWPES